MSEELETKIHVKTCVKEFLLPVVRDAIVLGRNSPIGGEAILQSLSYLHVFNFVSLKVEDDVIDQILIRENLLLKIPMEKLKEYVIHRVKPMMTTNEILQLDMDVEVIFEDAI